MLNTFGVTVVSYTTLMAAIFGVFFQTYATDPRKLTTPFCYLFLAPGILVAAAFSLINAYRSNMYRLGYYSMVFFEERFGGAGWETRLAAFRRSTRGGESGDPMANVLWALMCVSAGLFVFALVLVQAGHLWQLAAPAPLVLFMLLQHWAFVGRRKAMEQKWRNIRISDDVHPLGAAENRTSLS